MSKCFMYCISMSLLCVSLTVTQRRLRWRVDCFCCGNRGVKRWDGGLPRWGCVCVLLLLCVFVALGCSFPPVHFPSWIPQTQKVSSPASFSPLALSLLHFSGNNLLLPFPVPEEREIKSLLGLEGSVKIA